MTIYLAREPTQVIDFDQDCVVEAMTTRYVCDAHKDWCNEGTRFEPADDMATWAWGCEICAMLKHVAEMKGEHG